MQNLSNLDPVNQCVVCFRRAGKDPVTGQGIYLMQDARGGKVCNLCDGDGKLIRKHKMNKSEKRKFKSFKRSFKSPRNIPYVTLDKDGNEVKSREKSA